MIQTAASASGLGPGSVSTLFSAPQGTCVSLERSCLSPPTLPLSFQQGSPRRAERFEFSLEKQQQQNPKKQKVGERTREEKVLLGMRERKGEVYEKGLFPPHPPALPAAPRLSHSLCQGEKDQGHQKASGWTAWLHCSPPCC